MKDLKQLLDDANVWLNFWEVKSDNPKAPYLNLVIKDKTTGQTIKHPVWRDDKNYLYLGKPEAVEANNAPKNTEGKVTNDVAGIDDMSDDIPF